MASKFIIFAAVIATTRAGLIGAPLATTYAAQPVAVAKTVVSEEYDPHPQYSYGYDVQDGLTGDSKSHVESRDGDVVQGSYSLNDADGLRRTVDYTADPINGFNAVVRREPLVAKAVVAKTVVAAPAIAKYSAPVSQLTYSAPVVAKVAAPAQLAYAAAPAHVSYSAAPARISYAAAPAQISYAAAPAQYAYAAAPARLAYAAAPAHVSYAAAPAHVSYAAAPAHVSYAAAPAQLAYAASPAHVSYAAAPAQLSYAAPSLRYGTPLTYSSSLIH